jgi:hypothetical protein
MKINVSLNGHNKRRFMILKEKAILAICKAKSKTKGVLDVATLGAKYDISGATVRRVWARNKELCK